MQILINDLAAEATRADEMDFPEPDTTYEIWSPYDAFEAAHQLQEMLDQHK